MATSLTAALDKFSDLLNNMAPNQPRAKNGQWTKGAGFVGGSILKHNNPDSPSKRYDLHTADGLVAYIKANQGNHGFTELDFKKFKMLNPNGIKDGKIVHSPLPNKEPNQAQIAVLSHIMPPGTQIKSKYVTKKNVEEHEAQQKAQQHTGTPTSTVHPNPPTVTPTPAPVLPTPTPTVAQPPQVSTTPTPTTSGLKIPDHEFSLTGMQGSYQQVYHSGGKIGSIKPNANGGFKAKHDNKHIGDYATHEEALKAIKHAQAVKVLSKPERTSEMLPIISANKLTTLKTLPGSTAPKLVEDANGKKWVLKEPNHSGLGTHAQAVINNEVYADGMYRSMGIAVPNSGFVNLSLAQGMGKRSEYYGGNAKTLGDWEKGKSQQEIQAMHKEISKHFVMDALMANWDVVGQNKDNIMIVAGKPVRVDNGGALMYRAQGTPKGPDFLNKVEELKTMRDSSKNPQTAEIYKHLTDADIKQQIDHIVANKDTILKSTPQAAYQRIKERLDDLEAQGKALSTTGTKTSMPLLGTSIANPSPTPTASKTSIPLSSTLPTNLPKPAFDDSHVVSPMAGKPKFKVVSPKDLIEKGGTHKYETHTPEPTGELHKWAGSLSLAEKAAMKDYTGSNYGDLRTSVSEGTNKTFSHHTSAYTTQDFINAVSKAPGLDKPSIVYRGIRPDTFTKALMADFKKKGVGAVVTEDAHQSLTRDPGVAFGGSGGVFFQILSKTAKHIHEKSVHTNYGEHELLGLPNAMYRITKIVENPDTVETGIYGKKSPKMIVHLEEL